MTYWQISALLNASTALILGVFIFVKQHHRPVGRVFAFLNIMAFIWAISYFFWQSSKDSASALFWCRALTFGAAFLGPGFFHFIIHMLGRWREAKKWVLVTYSISVVQIIFIGTPLLLNGVRPLLTFPFWPKAGPLYLLQLVNYFIFPSFAVYLMWKDYPSASQIQKNQIKLMVAAAIIAFLSGASNYPQWYGIEVYPIFNGLVCLYPFILFYSIVRYRFLEIDTVIHRTILWMITSCVILIPLGITLYFTRPWLATLTWVQLTFLMTGLFYVYLFYYRHMQPKIDHLFRRRKYDYYKTLGEIGQKIGSELDINSVIKRLFKALQDILYVRNGMVLVQVPGQLDYSEAGSVGYEALAAPEKKESIVVTLSHDSALSQWLSSRQKALEREQVEVDPQYAPIKEEAMLFLTQNAIEFLIPVIMENKVNALLGMGKKENLQAYTMRDVELLENMGRQIGITIDNALHHEDIVEKERLAQELKLGREIQIALLPQETPWVSGLVVQGMMQPAKEIGGDYYDFITLPSKDQLAIVIGDVSGKGVAAGLLMAMAKTAIHTLSQGENSPKEILLRTNTILNKHIGGQKFMTLLYLVWQPQIKTMIYSSAGHEHILLYRHSTQNLEAIQSGGFMLGMLPDIDKFLEERQLKLAPKDKILLYTDGVTEAENQASDRFGLQRLKEAFIKYSSKPAQELMGVIKDEVYSFIGTHPQYDDITLVVLEATEEV